MMNRKTLLSSPLLYVGICTLAAALVGLSMRAQALATVEAPGLPSVIEQRLGSLQTDLLLSTEQQALFVKAHGSTIQSLAQIKHNHQQLMDQMKSTLAQSHPDLAALATERDRIETANRTLRQSTRADWLTLYASLSPAQVEVVKNRFLPLLGKIETFEQLLPQIVLNSL
jgi:response regulator RpfG family c-di-GMP phosphodiesterase